MPKILIELDPDDRDWCVVDSDRVDDAVANADYDERYEADWGRYLVEVSTDTLERWREVYAEARRAMNAVQEEMDKLVSDKRAQLEGEI
jgi:hypothetical protein